MASSTPRWLGRWWTYQQERFPLAAYGPLVLVFSLAAFRWAVPAVPPAWPAWPVAAATLSALLFFLLLRIADEFKDADLDRRYRPDRAVPRGLVTLGELGAVGASAAVAQLALALSIDVRLVPLLLGLWSYLGLMSLEFGVGAWLRAHPAFYLLSHMAVVPLLALYVAAFGWVEVGAAPAASFGWFLAVTLGNGVVLEVGRKLRAPADEAPGVETYTRAWGRPRALGVWLGALLGAGLATGAALGPQASPLIFGGAGLLLGGALVLAVRFGCRPTRCGAGRLDAVSGVWTLATYLAFVVVPWL